MDKATHNARILAMKHWRRYGDCAACRTDPGRPCWDLTYPIGEVYRADPHGVRELLNA